MKKEKEKNIIVVAAENMEQMYSLLRYYHWEQWSNYEGWQRHMRNVTLLNTERNKLRLFVFEGDRGYTSDTLFSSISDIAASRYSSGAAVHVYSYAAWCSEVGVSTFGMQNFEQILSAQKRN